MVSCICPDLHLRRLLNTAGRILSSLVLCPPVQNTDLNEVYVHIEQPHHKQNIKGSDNAAKSQIVTWCQSVLFL